MKDDDSNSFQLGKDAQASKSSVAIFFSFVNFFLQFPYFLIM